MEADEEHDQKAALDAGALFAGLGSLPLEFVLGAHPNLPKYLAPLDAFATATAFGGLLTVPHLQGNTARLEVLVHCALAFATGTRKPSNSTIAFWFSELGSGPCGHVEDPPEDVFTSIVTTSRGNFRILEGMWDSATFYLQRIVNVVERLPADEPFISIRESVFALLTLSDLVCEGADLARYTWGAEGGEPVLPNDVKSHIGAYRQRIVFPLSTLDTLGLSIESLSPFLLNPALRAVIVGASLQHSPLVECPVVRTADEVALVLPTAVSAAIRTFIIRFVSHAGLMDVFLKALADEYKRHFHECPALGTGRDAPLLFQETEHGIIARFAQEVDTGRMLHLVFTLDTLKGFEEDRFAGRNHDPNLLSAEIIRDIQNCREFAVAERGLQEGLTVIVRCGIGRAEAYALEVDLPGWSVAYLSAADVAVLSDVEDSSPQMIMRVREAESRLKRAGVRIVNVNGLLTLLAWARQLKGHLIPHAHVPELPEQGSPLTLLIEPSTILSIRKEAIERADRHAVQAPDGKWTRVRLADRSHFEEDRDNTVYAPCDHPFGTALPMVHVTQHRQWWCTVERPIVYDRWKMLSTWLPRIATVLERELELPDGALDLVVRFNGYSPQLPSGGTETVEQVLDAIHIDSDRQRHRVVIETDELFERGLHNPKNIAEAGLVLAIVRGFAQLEGENDWERIRDLSQQIVRNGDARDGHSFEARHFRDVVGRRSHDHVIAVNSIDDATLRIGLGWRIEKRQESGRVEGKPDCTAYLNGLVELLEGDLCDQLKRYDRESLIRLALENYECAMRDRRRWQNTTRAMLALHHNEAKTLQTIAEHESQNNAVLLASRVLVEAAACECPLEGGTVPGEMDLSQLMARLLLIVTYGGWSDAIHYDAMLPAIQITPLGDVHADLTFVESVVSPFGQAVQKNLVDASIERYDTLFQARDSIEQTEPQFDSRFLESWIEEHGFPLDDLRRICDDVEDIGIERDEAVFVLPQKELVSRITANVPGGEKVISALTTAPRPAWRIHPEGYGQKDRQPWRFRRRLSLLRVPIVRLDDSADPRLIIAPGLLRDALVYTVSGFHEGGFPENQVKTKSMKKWFSIAANRRGSAFTEAVAKRLEELGWRCEREVGVKSILRKRTEIDYGDVDVFAVHPMTKRILLIECKDLHFHKTTGELAEQLSDYRGGTRSEKRDSLRKHLDRSDVLRNNSQMVFNFAKMDPDTRIETWVVFRNPVPMLYASTTSSAVDGFTTFAELDKI